MKVNIFLSFILVGQYAFSECIPPKRFVKYTNRTSIGMYQRVHPDGKYVLHSAMWRGGVRSPSVLLFDLSNLNENGEATEIETPMNDEVYPIMTDWSLFASPNHPDGMRYYSLSKIESQKNSASQEFSDRSHNQYYQSIGELSDKGGKKQIRVTLYSGRRTKDYEIEMNEGSVVSQKEIKSGSICQNIVSPQVSGKSPEEIANLRERLTAIEREQSRAMNDFQNGKLSRDERDSIRARITRLTDEYRSIEEQLGRGNRLEDTFSSPVLSIDGHEVAALRVARGSYELRLFKINDDYSCELTDSLPFQVSKIQFSHPVPGKKGSITFLGSPKVENRAISQSVYVYNRDTKELTRIAKAGEFADYGYPGFTKDGRVIFPACKRVESKMQCGAQIVDPNQINPTSGDVVESPKSCIDPNGKGVHSSGGAMQERVKAIDEGIVR